MNYSLINFRVYIHVCAFPSFPHFSPSKEQRAKETSESMTATTLINFNVSFVSVSAQLLMQTINNINELNIRKR